MNQKKYKANDVVDGSSYNSDDECGSAIIPAKMQPTRGRPRIANTSILIDWQIIDSECRPQLFLKESQHLEELQMISALAAEISDECSEPDRKSVV